MSKKYTIIKPTRQKYPLLKPFERPSYDKLDFKWNPAYRYRDESSELRAGEFIKSKLSGAILRRRLGIRSKQKKAAAEYDLYNRQAFVTLALWGENEGKSQDWKMKNIDKALRKKKRLSLDEKRPWITYLSKWDYDPSVNYLIKLRL